MSSRRAAYYKREPDIVEILVAAKTRTFVTLDDQRHALISALRNTVCITIFSRGSSEPIGIHYSDCTPQQLGLWDGRGWNVPALAVWIRMHCPVCWRPLTSCSAVYCSNAHKQKAYRERHRREVCPMKVGNL